MLDRSLFIDWPERFIHEQRVRFLELQGQEIEEAWVAWDPERDERVTDEILLRLMEMLSVNWRLMPYCLRAFFVQKP